MGAALAPYKRGAGDATYKVVDGAHHRAFRTPDGPVLLRVEARRAAGEVHGTAWGPGADWALDRLPRMLGADDDISGFEPPAVLRDVWRWHADWRIGASGLVMDALVPAIIEQKVTGQEAFGAYCTLVRRFGEPAPGPGLHLGIFVPPAPDSLREIPSWEWLRLPIDGGRSRPLLAAARVASSLERAGLEEPEEFERRLTSIPGIGRWTSAEVRVRALGDADAVSFGDYHVAKDVNWALTGEEGDDDRLAEVLE
ncbi:MAG: DNA-3-methyladenine glycosylase 2 family protein, partial [Myxococcales bacterium]